MELEVNPIYLAAPDVMQWIGLHGVRLAMIDERCIATLPIPCGALREDKSCGVYGTPSRPEMCSIWPQSRAALAAVNSCGYSFTDETDEVEDYGG